MVQNPIATGAASVGGLGPGHGARGGNRGERQISFARNLTRSFFEMAHKRCNSNGRISKSEICGGELRAILVTGGHD